MLEQLKRLGRDSVIYGIGHITTRLLTFLLLPYYSFHLTPAEYGEVTLYFLFIAVVQTFYFYGLDISYLRFFGITKERDEQRAITGSAFSISLLTSAALTGLIVLFAGPLGSVLIKNPVHPEITAPMIRLCAGVLFFDTLSSFPFILLRGTMRPLRFVSVKLINVAANIGLNIWFVGTLHLSVSGILWANLIASAVSLFALLPDLLRYYSPKIDKVLLKEMVVFGLPNVPTYFFVMVVELANRKFVEVYRGLDEAGLFSAGYKLGMFMAVVTGAFRFAWQPFFLAHASDENAPRLFARVMTYYLLITATLFLGLSFFVGPLVMTKWPGVGYLIAPSFWPGLMVFPIILLAHIFDGIYANLMVGIYVKKMTRRLPMVTGAAAAVTLLLNPLLVPRFGMIAAAWVTLAAFVVQACLLWVVVRRFYTIEYEWSRIARLMIVCAASYTLGNAAGPDNLWLRIVALAAFPVLLLLSGFFYGREKYYLRRLFPTR